MQHLSRWRDIAVVERIDAANGPAVEAEALRQVVHQRLVGDCGLRHAETAEGAGGGVVGVDGARTQRGIGHLVGPHAVHGHTVGHRRPPRGVGAGVEIGLHLERREVALGVGRRLGPDARGMPLGGRGHRFRARVDDAHGPLGHPRRHRQQRLHRDVELAAEAATTRGRADAHARLIDAQHPRGLLQVHVGRLGAGRHLDAVRARAGGSREPGFGLDIGVLHERGLEAALGGRSCARVPGLHIAALQVAARQHVVGDAGVNSRRARRQRRVDAGERFLNLPFDRQFGIGNAFDGSARADQRQHSLAAEAHEARRQHRLVLHPGEDAEGVLARHIFGGQDSGEAGVASLDRIEVAQRKARAGVRRAHHPQPQRLGGRLVGAELVGAGDLGPAVHPRQTCADSRVSGVRPMNATSLIHLRRRHGV